MIRIVRHLTLLMFALLPAVVPSRVHAQQMRRSGGDGPGPAGEAPKGLPRNPRHPYEGVWDGMFAITGPSGERNPVPVAMVFGVADSAKDVYTGATILPNGARAPHLETEVAKGEMKWKQTNSGGGFWMYSGKM